MSVMPAAPRPPTRIAVFGDPRCGRGHSASPARDARSHPFPDLLRRIQAA
jgi:hypothetical protein